MLFRSNCDAFAWSADAIAHAVLASTFEMNAPERCKPLLPSVANCSASAWCADANAYDELASSCAVNSLIPARRSCQLCKLRRIRLIRQRKCPCCIGDLLCNERTMLCELLLPVLQAAAHLPDPPLQTPMPCWRAPVPCTPHALRAAAAGSANCGASALSANANAQAMLASS